jgi:hypothetical protein
MSYMRLHCFKWFVTKILLSLLSWGHQKHITQQDIIKCCISTLSYTVMLSRKHFTAMRCICAFTLDFIDLDLTTNNPARSKIRQQMFLTTQHTTLDQNSFSGCLVCDSCPIRQLFFWFLARKINYKKISYRRSEECNMICSRCYIYIYTYIYNTFGLPYRYSEKCNMLCSRCNCKTLIIIIWPIIYIYIYIYIYI